MSVIVFIRDSRSGMPLVQSVHLVGLTLLLAAVFVVNLRLAGVAMMDSAASDWLARQLRPWMIRAPSCWWSCRASSFFVGTPAKYLASNPFRVKMVALGVAILFQSRGAPRGSSRRTPRRAREP